MLKAALMMQVVVAGVERPRMVALVMRLSCYHEDGLPPRPFAFD